MPTGAFRIRVVSPWAQNIVLGDETHFSTEFPEELADASLFYWEAPKSVPHPNRPYLWYNCEPEWSFQTLGDGWFREVRERVPRDRFVNHAHPLEPFRVPHVTHWGIPQIEQSNARRLRRAVAIVSNFGSNPASLEQRTHFVTSKYVDLYGKTAAWARYRTTILGRVKPPRNFKGPIPNDDEKWHGAAKRRLMATYHAAICLENSVEPNYFTEKFVEAVIAGCVPIYHPHPSVAKTFLREATWIDPVDHGFNPTNTIAAAMIANREIISEQNASWLLSTEPVLATRGEAVLARLGSILRRQAAFI